MSADVERLVRTLGLAPHPEGGFYVETQRSPLKVKTPYGERAAFTSIYFLLAEGTMSALHRVKSDETWHWYDGSPLELTMLEDSGKFETHVLGRDIVAGHRPQLTVRGGLWQAAVPLGGWALCGCTVSPGFEFEDFELPTRADLQRRFPAMLELINKLTRPR